MIVCTTGWVGGVDTVPICCQLTCARDLQVGCHSYLITFEFACHYFSTLDDTVDVGRTIRAEGDVKRPWLTSTMQPSHDFIAGEQAKLLLQAKLNLLVNDYEATKPREYTYIGFCEAATNDHDTGCKNAFSKEWPKKSLHVWREPEGNRIV